MKPLTIEELKAMNAGDWIWLVFPALKVGEYAQVVSTTPNFIIKRLTGQSMAGYYNYNDIWLAYKNKEQAEAKGEIVETGKYFIEPEQLPNRPLRYLICDYSVSKGVRDMCDTLEEAERRLAELKGELLK